ncbi:bifunctional YncE family protein/alkaline phosphatase family protein [Ktedonobacter racemifer]|uniref:40-residue YVTN family beta-propeller repeat protein n=1 Tax=Ktedonobacter racemifer DSM 44963 TaxID=485913 RepID=D6TTS9_KTERA|nr:bifunctional YncE family protein/alkaline phosphatase family protein [Ktedonobacter racemifer]EFH83830.1 40-residue YVTN family beta-propeller repeat protein [Ktedonobacter racemifer DSM 44963]
MQNRNARMQQLSQFVRKHRRITVVVALLLVLTIIPSTIFAAGHVWNDNGEPGTHDGKTQLINNWTITPAGKQLPLGDLPLNSVLSPDGRYLLVVNSGAGIQSLQVISTKDNKVIQSVPYYAPHSVFVGLAYSPDGKHVYASGGGEDVVHTFSVLPNGVLSSTGDVVIGTLRANPFPTGLSVSPDGKTLYVANNLANTISVVDTATKVVTSTIKIGGYPYTTLVSNDGKTIYASNWGDATLSVIDASSKTVKATIGVGQHPTAMVFSPDGERLYVTDANSDAVSVVDTNSYKEVRRISVSPYAKAPLSSSPEGLAITPNGKTLYVVDAGNNEVVVLNLKDDDSAVLGRIPTAWYPTSVNVSRDSGTLYVTNGKGLGAGPNNKKGYPPNPTRKNAPIIDAVNGYNDGYCNCTFNNYSGSMIVGTLSSIEVPSEGKLALYTQQVARNDHQKDKSVYERNPGNPIPLPGGTSPIKHVIYIIKENRTYDQVFGDEKLGDNDPNLTLFPKNNTPNLHSLVERFGLLDNFYADAEVSADGHNWASSANASDYNEKMWPQDYSPGQGRNRPYDFEGGSSINLSPGGYLWDSAAQAKVTYRDYGEFYQFSSTPPTLIPESQASTCAGPIAHSYTGVTIPAGQVLCFPAGTVNDKVTPNLVGHFDPKFRTFDSNYRETDRVAEWQREFNQFVTGNDLPQLELLRLPNDHTQGTTPGKLTPQAAVAENDNAVGQVIDILSHSKYWKDTAVFVTEDDAQNGPDHVDAHRTESLVISPYTSGSSSRVDHTLYDTAAMVRTMELILGLHPLSQYDANAMPMWRLFNNKPNLAPYDASPESIPVTQLNTATTYGAQQSAKMDFSQEDRMPMDQLNQILWHAIKGANVPYPTPNGASQSGNDSDG